MKVTIFKTLWLGALAMTLCLATPAAATPPIQADSALYFDVDFARFSVNDTVTQVEVYIAVPRAALRFAAADGRVVANFECQVVITKDSVELVNHKWQAHSAAHDSSEIKPGQLLFTQARFQLKVGTYRFFVRVQDQNRPASQGIRAFQIVAEPYPANQLALSDLQLAARLERDTTRSIFHKNRYLVLPNPGAVYGLELPMLFFYAEIYNLRFPSDSSYSVQYRIYDGDGREVKALPSRRRLIAGAKLVEVNGFNIVSLKSGSYFFEVRVVDHGTGSEASRRHKFFVYREKDRAEASDFAAAPFELLAPYFRGRAEKELDKEFETARYISTAEERKIYGSLQRDGKPEFLAKFWQKRDLSPETPHNEFREDYLARVKSANESFSGFREGWKTDMGRVLLIYGRPEEIERFPSSNESRSYQIWHYFEIEGGVEFVFIDLKSGGEFELVHSSARNELQDPTWQRWLNPGR